MADNAMTDTKPARSILLDKFCMIEWLVAVRHQAVQDETRARLRKMVLEGDDGP